MPSSPQAIIRRARAFPFLECWISANWQKDDLGLVEILLGRQQPDGGSPVKVSMHSTRQSILCNFSSSSILPETLSLRVI